MSRFIRLKLRENGWEESFLHKNWWQYIFDVIVYINYYYYYYYTHTHTHTCSHKYIDVCDGIFLGLFNPPTGVLNTRFQSLFEFWSFLEGFVHQEKWLSFLNVVLYNERYILGQTGLERDETAEGSQALWHTCAVRRIRIDHNMKQILL